MMTRKHYTQIAALVEDLAITTSDPTQAPDIAVADFVHGLANMFAADNPNFDRVRFVTACGMGANT